MTRSTHPTSRNVVHVLTAPIAPGVVPVLLDAIDRTDRSRWYPSLVVEHAPDESNSELSPAELGADAARTLGIPVTAPRSPTGTSGRDWIRTFLDEWFYVRDARPSIVHVHASTDLPWSAPVRWVTRAMRRTPTVETLYRPNPNGDVRVRAITTTGGARRSVRTVDTTTATDLIDLYDLAVGPARP